MLVVLQAVPVAAPLEAERLKDYLTEVVFVDFVREILAAIHIITRRLWLNARPMDARILQGIDVHRQSKGMIREYVGPCNGAVVETRGVVGLHGGLVKQTAR